MLAKTKVLCKRFLANEDGLETVEYAIITGLIVAATITVVAAIGQWVLTQFQNLESGLSGAGP